MLFQVFPAERDIALTIRDLRQLMIPLGLGGADLLLVFITEIAIEVIQHPNNFQPLAGEAR